MRDALPFVLQARIFESSGKSAGPKYCCAVRAELWELSEGKAVTEMK